MGIHCESCHDIPSVLFSEIKNKQMTELVNITIYTYTYSSEMKKNVLM